MSSALTEQARYESLLKTSTDAVELFRRQYRIYQRVPGVQRSITDGELMAACAFRTYEQWVFHVLFKKWDLQQTQILSTMRLPYGRGLF
jgi:hypothetical protein